MPKKPQKRKRGAVAVKQAKILAKLSENIRNNKGNSQMQAAIDAGYSESYAKTGRFKETDTWQQLMEDMLPDTLLTKVHTEGLKATRVHSSHSEPDMVVPDYAVRHKYLDTAYKVKKRYDNTLKLKHEFAELSDEEIEERIAGILSGALGAVAGEGSTSQE